MTSYLHNGYDVINYFAKFEKFLPHKIIIPSFMTVGSQMPELDRGIFVPSQGVLPYLEVEGGLAQNLPLKFLSEPQILPLKM